MVQYILQHWYFHIFLVLPDCSKYGSHGINCYLPALLNHATYEYYIIYIIQCYI